MSHEAVTWAMDDAPMLLTEAGKPDTTSRHVLQVLGEHARKDGTNSHPSLIKIQYRTGYNRRTVQRALQRLEEGGLIRATGVVHDCTVWALALHLVRPASDLADLKAAEERDRAATADRQRKSRARRVTPSADVTVTHADDVTQADVTHSASARHAVEQRDVTHAESGRHALKVTRTVNEPSAEPPSNPGDGRRPTTGSGAPGAGGSAAAGEVADEEMSTAAIGAVLGLLPSALCRRLPERVPATVTDTIRAELARGVTVPQLVARAERRWWNHGYESDAETAGGPGILRPVGVAVALLRAGNCTSARCDDGVDLDTGARCRTCERAAEDRRAAQGRPVQGAFPVMVPAGADDHPATPQAPAPRRHVHWKPLVNCNGCDRAHRSADPDALCPSCQANGRAVNA